MCIHAIGPGKNVGLHLTSYNFVCPDSNIEHILAVCAYGINEVPTPQLPAVSADEKAAMEVSKLKLEWSQV